MDLATIDPAQVRRIVLGSAEDVRRLVTALAPFVRARIARVVRRRGRSDSMIDDLSQEAFVELFEDRGRTLLTWDPARGIALSTFCQVVAERVALSILRSGRRSGWREDATEASDDEISPDSAQRPDRRAASRELLERLLDRLREDLSARGYELFRALFVEEREVEAIGKAFGMSADSVYAWRSRLSKRVRLLLDEIEPPSDRALSARTHEEVRR